MFKYLSISGVFTLELKDYLSQVTMIYHEDIENIRKNIIINDILISSWQITVR